MTTYLDEILADIDWRVSELAIIKSMPIKYGFKPEHKDIYVKYSVPAIYAIWEGFIKNCFVIYSNHLNSLSIKRVEVAPALLTHQIDAICDFNNPRQSFDSKLKLVEQIDDLLQDVIVITPKVPTESNVNLKVLNKILERFCIIKMDMTHGKGLDKLLRFRNTIAHGENSLIVNMIHVTEFVTIVENLMLDIAINIDACEKLKSYKR